jgi:hypothetical protein
MTDAMFTMSASDREAALLPRLMELQDHHRRACEPYGRMLAATGHGPGRGYERIADLPWLPVRLFKSLTLKSIPDDDVFRVLTSSGTTGDVSRIHLDRGAAATQSRVLAETLQTVLGPQRLPMLIVDSPSIVRDRASFSARAAGVLGMMTFGRDHTWILDDDGRPDAGGLRAFLARHPGEPFLIFGFTFMVWSYLYDVARDEGLDLSGGTLIHSGGWKKLADRAVDHATFRRAFAADTGLTRIHDFYGMVEQIGVVYLEGPEGGSLYCPDVATVLIRDPETWEALPPGRPGLIQVVSTLPESYPGHSLLTEDLGVIQGIDDGSWPGPRFRVIGRLPRAEARGCSDTFTVAEAVERVSA